MLRGTGSTAASPTSFASGAPGPLEAFSEAGNGGSLGGCTPVDADGDSAAAVAVCPVPGLAPIEEAALAAEPALCMAVRGTKSSPSKLLHPLLPHTISISCYSLHVKVSERSAIFEKSSAR